MKLSSETYANPPAHGRKRDTAAKMVLELAIHIRATGRPELIAPVRDIIAKPSNALFGAGIPRSG